ncbi:hypothetical protein, partial [Janthinobacterium agaricidamnosum]|uniref:hypothetical protein n=1 Tax=Janthinobacterium agaricidamnosum TaxID=55508 RepID=UPI001C3F2130
MQSFSFKHHLKTTFSVPAPEWRAAITGGAAAARSCFKPFSIYPGRERRRMAAERRSAGDAYSTGVVLRAYPSSERLVL